MIKSRDHQLNSQMAVAEDKIKAVAPPGLVSALLLFDRAGTQVWAEVKPCYFISRLIQHILCQG